MTLSKGKRSRVRSTPKGRPVDVRAREEVVALLGDASRRRDLLIEYLHLIQDRFGCLSAAHRAFQLWQLNAAAPVIRNSKCKIQNSNPTCVAAV
jgi:lipase chaperone LimK